MKNDYLPALSKVAGRYGLTAIYAFGSRSQEVAARLQGRIPAHSHPDSDLDIAVQPLPGRSLSAQEKVEICLTLEDLFEVRRVDLIVLKEAKPFLALDIIKGELLYCDDLDRQAEEELFVLRRAGDLAYFERERREMILHGEGK
jgi:predicted nucleotidyltransferase